MPNNQDNQEVENQVETQPQVSNFLDLSDDEIANLPTPNFDEYEPEVADTTEDGVPEDTDEEDYDEGLEDDEVSDHEVQDVFDDEDDTDEPEVTDKPEKVKGDKESKSDEVSDTSKYKEVYDRLFGQPIRANGKDLELRSIDDVIQLVQMGANYNKKMAGIKDQVPYLKILEKNNLLDERKLSYLIDLDQGKPEAIARLIKENEIDVYDFDAEAGEGYVPQSRQVSTKEIALQEVLDDLSDSPTYQQTVNYAGNVWDAESQSLIVDQPERLRILDEHMGTGMFQAIWDEVERQKSLNYLKDVSDFQAYEYIGSLMNDEGLLDQYLNATDSPKRTTALNDQKAQKSKANKAKQEAIKRKKQAAAAPSAKSNSNTQPIINPLDLSDEDFAKFGAAHLM